MLMKTLSLSVLLLALVLAVGGASAQESTDSENVPVNVEDARIITNANGTYSLAVSGTLGTGCELPVEIERTVEEKTLIVNLYQVIPADTGCGAVVVPYNEVIMLTNDSGNPALITSINVNGMVVNIPGGDGPIGRPPSDEDFEVAGPIGRPPGAEDFAIPGDDLEPAPARVMYGIETVEWTQVDGVWGFNVTGMSMVDCEFPDIIEQSYDEATGWLKIEIFREIPANVRCQTGEYTFAGFITPHDAFLDDLTLSTDASEGRSLITRVVEVNNYIGALQLDAATFEAQEAETEDPVLTLDPEMLSLADVTLEALTVVEVIPTVEGTTATLEITYNADGCELPTSVEYTFEGVTIEGNVVRARTPEVQVCPLILRTLQTTVTLENLSAGTYGYNFGGVIGEFTVTEASSMPPPPGSDPDIETVRVPHVIESVEAVILESFPPQIMINVVGYQSDGCELPVMVDTTVDGNNITVEIYREVSIAQTCIAVIVPYEENINLGAFEEPGTYSIDVNGTKIEVEL